MKSGSVGASIVGGNANVDRIRVLLILCVLKKEVRCQYMRAYIHLNGITNLKKYVPVAIIVKGIGVENLELGHVSTSVLIFSYQLLIWESPLRIFIEEFHIRMGGGRVEIVVEFLHVLPMITLVTCNTEKTFLEDMVLTVPDRKREAETLVVV